MLVASHEGMFGGRDYEYLRVMPATAAVTPIWDRGPRAAAPPIVDALLPVAAALVAALFAALLVRSLRRRRSGEKLLWACGFGLFAVAAGCEALAQRSGWSVALFRAYYLCGGVLTVAYLGAGSAWLHLPRRARDMVMGALAVATIGAAATVAIAPVHAGALAATAIGRPPPNGAIGGGAELWAIALNTFGSLWLIGGALYSAIRRRRVRANLWIAGGALVLAASTSMSRSGSYSLMYLGELVGIAAMFCGFALPHPERRPARRRATAPLAAPAGTSVVGR
jgi:hypothetical protein